MHEACLGSNDDHRATISHLQNYYAENLTACADRLWTGLSPAMVCTCVTEIEVDMDGAHVDAVTTHGGKVDGRNNNAIKQCFFPIIGCKVSPRAGQDSKK